MSDSAETCSAGRGRKRLRWTVGAMSLCSLGAAGVLMLGVAGSASADSSTDAGQGSAYAQSLQITPHEGSLAVGAIFGEALAGHTLNFSRAQSQGVDLGAVGAALKGYNCGMAPSAQQTALVPDPLEAESGSPGAAQGQSQMPSNSNYFANEFVKADDTPYSQADTIYAGNAVAPSNAFIVAGMHSKAWSGIVNGQVVDGATSDIGQLSIGGVVTLNHLDWTVLYPLSGGQPTGSFTMGQAIIGGVPLPSSADLSAVTDAANTALAAIGIQLNFPKVTNSQGIESVTPLEVDVVPNNTRDSLIDPVVVALQPTYYQIANGLENGFANDQAPFNSLGAAEKGPGAQLAQALCQSDTPITVLDITLAAFDGGGFFSASLGGVNASSAPVATNPFSLAALGFGNLNIAGSSQFVPGTGALSGSVSLPGTSAPVSTGTAPTEKNSLPARVRLPSKLATGSLLAAGLGGLGLLALLVEGDRRMMRRAQRAAVSKE